MRQRRPYTVDTCESRFLLGHFVSVHVTWVFWSLQSRISTVPAWPPGPQRPHLTPAGPAFSRGVASSWRFTGRGGQTCQEGRRPGKDVSSPWEVPAPGITCGRRRSARAPLLSHTRVPVSPNTPTHVHRRARTPVTPSPPPPGAAAVQCAVCRGGGRVLAGSVSAGKWTLSGKGSGQGPQKTVLVRHVSGWRCPAGRLLRPGKTSRLSDQC